MTQDRTPERDPIEEYWASYGRPSPFTSEPLLPFNWPEKPSPWVDGRYAFYAILFGLFAMLLMSVPAGASPIIALYLEPIGPITELPWDFVEPVELIDMGPPLEELERQMQRQEGECDE